MRNITIFAFAAWAGACDPVLDHSVASDIATRPPAGAEATAARGVRWQQRMTIVHARARTELAIDDQTAAKLMSLQTDLRTFKHQIRAEVEQNGLDAEKAAARMRDRLTEFRIAVAALIGPERARKYVRLIAEVRADDGGRKP